MEKTVLKELQSEVQEAQAESAVAIDAAKPSWQREEELAAEREDVEFRRKSLLDQVNQWARSDVVILELLKTEELHHAMAKAHAIATYYGLDTTKLSRLYELGKRTIRDADFALPDRPVPDKDEADASYYNRFFKFAFQKEEDIARYRAEIKQYKVVLYKRVTLAYIRALLAAGEPLDDCTPATREIEIAGRRFNALECPDPVVNHLREYVSAIQKVAAADADAFVAQSEIVLAEQTAMMTVVSGVPLVGEAMDFYALWSGEDLAGECLTRTDIAITTFFSLVPFVPTNWWSQAINRAGLEEPLSNLLVTMANLADASGEYLTTLALRIGVDPRDFEKARSLLLSDITVTTRGVEIRPAQMETMTILSRMEDNLTAAQVVQRNTMMAYNSQRALRELPPSVVARMKKTSDRIMDANLNRLQRSEAHVIAQSNMVEGHLREFKKMAKREDMVVGFRYVNPNSTKLIAADAATKWMDVKPKSSGWGPHKGYLPYEQKFSKIMDPDALKKLSPEEAAEALAKAEEFSSLADKCLEHPMCFKMDLILPEPDSHAVLIRTRPDGSEVPILKSPDGKYLDGETRAPIDIGDDPVRPMEVMAAKNSQGELAPLTADYDLLAIGTKSDVQRADYTEFTGFRTEEEQRVIDLVNQAGRDAGYGGGNLSHHGPENQFYKSPGALAEDTVMTMVDPKRGMTTIPRCDLECMKHWCKTSGQCGTLPICDKDRPSPPCVPVDPDRLLKDYFHAMRLEGYSNLRPNKVWGWGKSNGLSGWQPKVLLERTSGKPHNWVYGQYTPARGFIDTIRDIPFGQMSKRAKSAASKAAAYLFSCPGEDRNRTGRQGAAS